MNLNWRFIFKTAYRDSRKNRLRLFMFMSSILLGITALVAINSFNYNLVRDIDSQSKSLLGADLRLSANKPLTPELKEMTDSLPGESAEENELFSMAYIPKSDGSQFVRIKAVEGNFPFYGKIQTVPESAAVDYNSNRTVLVDDGVMIEHGLAP
ncbi:MAG: ABC transporter permease, partial [Saprospiraceae bacterium]